MNPLRLFFWLCLGLVMGLSPSANAIGKKPVPAMLRSLLAEGDLVFIQSTTDQSRAIREATGSDWTHVGIAMRDARSAQVPAPWVVIEAARSVTATPIDSFLGRSKGGRFAVKRLKESVAEWDEEALGRLRDALQAMTGKPYDVFFEWSNAAIYCSELTYKAIVQALGSRVEIGKLERFRDLKLDGPEVRRLIVERLEKVGKKLNIDEPIVTPRSQFESPLLRAIY
jgi:hypothetical protein